MTFTTVLTMVQTSADINDNTDVTETSTENKLKNDGKLKTILEEMPTRPRVVIILGTLHYSTEQCITVQYSKAQHRTYITSILQAIQK